MPWNYPLPRVGGSASMGALRKAAKENIYLVVIPRREASRNLRFADRAKNRDPSLRVGWNKELDKIG